MRVIKRDGRSELVDLNKVTTRITKLCSEIETTVIDPIVISQKVCNALHDNVNTTELDQLASEIAISMATQHPDYGKLAGYIVASDLHKQVSCGFVSAMEQLHESGFLHHETLSIVMKHRDTLCSAIDYAKDYSFDYFALKTLMKGYLQKVGSRVVERPQDMFMRVSIGIHGDDIDCILETYSMMSDKLFTHATPTLFNSGSTRPQLASCYLVMMQDDSISGIYNTLSDCAMISKWAGGIGLSVHNIRGAGADIRDVKGACSGIVPMLKVFNDTARYVNQEGKRPGSIAVYLQVDHPDIFSFLDLKKNSGDEESRARDLFYAIWVPDLFMQRVRDKGTWSLFCPHTCPGLADCYGENYEKMYQEYESAGLQTRSCDAQELWAAICSAQIETGTPYVLYKDACNAKSNQQNLGVIKSSNLCTEILEYTAPDEIAVCNLASICLPQFVKDGVFDHKALHAACKVVTRNLNKVIDRGFYPVDKARYSNMRHRPIGIGVQGLADVYALMRLPFDSEPAAKVNKQIFETLYHASMEASVELAQQHGAYETFSGSPLSQGKFQFDLWGATPEPWSMYDWEALRQNVVTHGARNSLLLAPMPTATTSQIMGNNEAIEPYTSNIYLRRTIAGEFVVINRHLMKDLINLGIWSTELKDKIIYHEGSVQPIKEIPNHIKQLYKTAWELSQKVLINQAADRGVYVCQSQSLNLFVPRPSVKLLSSMHFYTWSKGLKTGMYYLRTKPASNPTQFTIDTTQVCESCSA